MSTGPGPGPSPSCPVVRHFRRTKVRTTPFFELRGTQIVVRANSCTTDDVLTPRHPLALPCVPPRMQTMEIASSSPSLVATEKVVGTGGAELEEGQRLSVEMENQEELEEEEEEVATGDVRRSIRDPGAAALCIKDVKLAIKRIRANDARTAVFKVCRVCHVCHMRHARRASCPSYILSNTLYSSLPPSPSSYVTCHASSTAAERPHHE